MKFGRLTAPLLAAIAAAESSEHVNYAFLAAQRTKAQQKHTAAASAATIATRVVGEVKTAERAVEAELRKDHAPLALQQEEQRLLEGALKAANSAAHAAKQEHHQQSKEHHATKRTTMLSTRNQAATGLQAMAARVANEVSSAEHVVEAQLKKDHAPVALQQEEKQLLDGALEKAEEVVHMRKHKAAATHKAASGSQTTMLRSLASDLRKTVSEDGARMKETAFVEGEAMKALKEEHIDDSVQQKVASLLDQARSLEKKEIAVDQKGLRSVRAMARDTAKEEYARRQHHAKGASRSSSSAEAEFGHAVRKLAKEDESRAAETAKIEVAAEKALQEVHAGSAAEQKVKDLLQEAQGAEKREAAIEMSSISSGSSSRTKVASKAQMDRSFSKAMNKLVKEERHTLSETKYVEGKAEEALQAAGADDSMQKQVKELLDKAQMYEKKDIQLSKNAAKPLAAQQPQKAAKKAAGATVQRLKELQQENSALRNSNERLREEHKELIREVHLEAENTALMAQNKVLAEQNSQLDSKLSEQ